MENRGGVDSENIYIEGDNLDALKLLQETYLGKVKMIYIDPPYNTGNDSFVYEDDSSITLQEFFAVSGQRDENGNLQFDIRENNESNGRFHTDWLNMMYPRLKLAKNFLTDDGFIAVSISEEEYYNLRKVMNEIFGEKNYRNSLAVRRYDKNLNLQFINEGLPTLNVGLEYIVIYSNNITSKMRPVYKKAAEGRVKEGYWKGFWNNADRPTMRYEILGVEPLTGQWKWKKEVAYEALRNYQEYVDEYSTKMSLEDYWAMTGYSKKFIRRNMSGKGKNKGVEHWVSPTDSILRNSNWSDLLISTNGGIDIPFSSPKNPEVIIELLKLFNVNEFDIVMDFFSGSASTAHALMQINTEDNKYRKYILVQLPELIDMKADAYKLGYKTICDIGEDRIRRAGKKIKEETGADIDYGFRCFKVDSSNMKDVYYRPGEVNQENLFSSADNIKEDRTPEDLLIQVMLDLGVLLSSKIEKIEIDGKKVFSVADGYLMACFDKDVTEETVTAIAKKKPFYAVFRDSSMSTDSVAVNFDQIFETYSPQTVRKVL